MFPLFESIKVLKGEICNAEFHNERINKALLAYYNKSASINILNYFDPEEIKSDLVKFRLSYNEETFKREFIPYKRKHIQNLKLISIDPSYTYAHKYSDRSQLDHYFSQRENADDVLLCKEGRIKDSSYANIVFRKNEKWYTPAFPLLEGTMRAKLIANKSIEPVDIFIKDLPSFDSFTLINALNDLGEMPILSLDKIENFTHEH